MLLQNYTLGITVDEFGNLTVDPNKITVANLPTNATAYNVFDFGVDHFNGAFSHLVEAQGDVVQNAGACFFWALGDVVDEFQGFINGFHNGLFQGLTRTGAGTFLSRMEEIDGGARFNSDSIALSAGVLYYFNPNRDETVGTFGTFYGSTYLDAERTILVDEPSIALHSSKKDFQYLYGMNSRDSAVAGNTWSGFIQNLDIQEAAPEVIVPELAPVPIITTHNQDAKNRLLQQYKKLPGIEGLIEAYFGNQIQDLENALHPFFNRLNIEVSEGAQLNGIGNIVNQERLGLSDIIYRLFIRARIGANVSEGESERLIEVWKLITQANTVKLEEIFPAEVNLATDVALPDELIDFAYALIQEVSSGGVGVGITTFLPEDAFAFEGADPAITKGFGEVISQGITDGTTTNKLIDSSALFVTNGVMPGMLAMNDADGTQAIIVSVAQTILSLDIDIFITGKDYYINASTGGKLAKIQGV